VVSATVGIVLRLATSGGEVLWNRDVDGHPGSVGLLTEMAYLPHPSLQR
jgi:hypothetical protein